MSLTRLNSIEQSKDCLEIIEEKNYKTEEIIRRYAKGRFLGKGGFAKCYEFTNLETKQAYAAKVITKASLTKSKAKQKLMSEIRIHKSLQNNNIVQFFHFFEDGENVYILLEICSNQTLNELLKRRKRLSELEVQCYVLQILNALKYLHLQRIIHRDLKLGNLFLSEKMEIKVGDFGLATKLEYDGERKRTICGTPNYIAPEILENRNGHSYEVDMWSLGVIIYTALIGKPPFETDDVNNTYKNIRTNSYTFPEPNIISPSARDIICRILITEPTKRLSIDEMLSHDFLANTNSIPKLMPISTLACPPSTTFVKQFIRESEQNKIQIPSSYLGSNRESPRKLQQYQNLGVNLNITPKQGNGTSNAGSRSSLKEKKDFINTDRLNNNLQGMASTNKASGYISQQGEDKYGNEVYQRNQLTNKFSSNEKLYNVENVMSGRASSHEKIMTQLNLNRKDMFYQSQRSNTLLEKGPDIWVKKQIDYSSKYGIGYLLSNGSAGVFFNDSTKILLEQNSKVFIYIERRGIQNLNDYPRELQKKVTLLQHFRNYLEGNSEKQEQQFNLDDYHHIEENIKFVKQQTSSSEQNAKIYVKKWIRTRHAIMFRLSNKVVQVIFQDNTEIILSSELRVVTYVNKKGERLTYPITQTLESSNAEMAKRLKYTKDILSHMLGGNQDDINNGAVITKEKYSKKNHNSNTPTKRIQMSLSPHKLEKNYVDRTQQLKVSSSTNLKQPLLGNSHSNKFI